MSTAGTAGGDVEPLARKRRRERLPRALRREEDRQPAVRDLRRLLHRARAQAPRGRSGSPCAAAAPSASAACRARSRPRPGTAPGNARRRTRPPRGAIAARTSSTYSRVLPSGLPHGSPCQPSTTCGPDVPRPSSRRPPESRSSVTAVIAVFAGVRAGSCRIAVPSLIVSVVRAEPGEHAHGVRAPGLCGPRGRVAEPLRLLGQLDQLERVRPRRGVAHVEAEAHRVRC